MAQDDTSAERAVTDAGNALATYEDRTGVHMAACQILERIDLMIGLAEMADLPDRARIALQRAKAEAERATINARRAVRQH